MDCIRLVSTFGRTCLPSLVQAIGGYRAPQGCTLYAGPSEKKKKNAKGLPLLRGVLHGGRGVHPIMIFAVPSGFGIFPKSVDLKFERALVSHTCWLKRIGTFFNSRPSSRRPHLLRSGSLISLLNVRSLFRIKDLYTILSFDYKNSK